MSSGNKKYNNQSANNISRGQNQSINTRGPAPSDNQQRQDYRQSYSQPSSYSQATRLGLPGAGQAPQPVANQMQPNLGPQVNSINSQVPPSQIQAPNVPQAQVITSQVQMQNVGRFQQTSQGTYHQGRQQGRQVNIHRQQNSVPTSSSVTLQHSVQHPPNNPASNLVHNNPVQIHQVYINPNIPNQFQLLNSQQHLQQFHYQQQPFQAMARPPNTLQYQYTFPTMNQHAFGQYGAYAYAPAMMPPQMPQHQRGPVPIPQNIQQQSIQLPVSTVSTVGTVGTTNEVNDVPQVQVQHKPHEKRERKCALIEDPNTGHIFSEEELKSNAPLATQNQAESLNSETQSGASSLRNSPSTSTNKSGDIDVAMQFQTQVSKAAFEPLTSNESSLSTANSSVEVANSELKSESEKISDSEKVLSSDTIDSVTNKDTNNAVLTELISKTSVNAFVSSSIATQSSDIKSQSSVSVLPPEIKTVNVVKQNGESSTEITLNQAKEEAELKANANQKKEPIQQKDSSTKEKNEVVLEKSGNIVEDQTKHSSTDNIASNQTVIPPLPIDSKPLLEKNDSIDKEVEIKNEVNNRINNENDVDKMNNKNEVSTIESQQIKIQYSEDQWSPQNPTGKKQYDKKFLLSLQKSEIAQKMPEKLIETRANDIIRQTPHAHELFSTNNSNMDDMFLPGFLGKQNYSLRMTAPNVGRRQSQPGRGGHLDKQRKIISTSLNQDVKLHTTENAWRPNKLDGSVDQAEQETLELLKTFRGILNKLTPQKYETLIKKIDQLKIDSEDRVRRVLDLIFDKAVDEPAFCLQYANLCKYLSQINMFTKEEENQKSIKFFQKCLLLKCQSEFEADVYATVKNLEERQKEIEECQDAEKKKMLHEILDDDMRRARKRSLGNIKLIGELYKLNMLKGAIMAQCIYRLCYDRDEESFECLCALLKTIGCQIEEEFKDRKLDINSDRTILDDWFRVLQNIVDQKTDVKVSARVRFMIQDVIELRQNGWKPRRENEIAPKTIDEIHLQVQQEEERKAQELEQHKQQKRNDDRDRKKTGRHEGDSWQTVGPRKSQTLQQQSHQSSNIPEMINKMYQNQMGAQEVKLGPTNVTWFKGSHGGSHSKTTNVEEQRQNRFNVLQPSDNKRYQSNRQPEYGSRDSSKGRSSQSGPRKPPVSDQTSGRESAIQMTKQLVSRPSSDTLPFRNESRNSSRDNSTPSSRNSSMRIQTPESEYVDLKGKPLLPEELELKAKESIKEYLSISNLEEPLKDVKEYFNRDNVHLYIYTTINYAFEITSHDRKEIGKLFNCLLTKRYISLEQFIKGLKDILEVGDDIEIDVPQCWTYLAETIALLLIDLPTEKRKFFLQNIIDMSNPRLKPLLIAKVIHEIAKLTSPEKARDFWLNCDLSWNRLLTEGQNIEEYAKEKDVEFTIKNVISNSLDSKLELLDNEIIKMIAEKKSNDDIQEFLKQYFITKETVEPRFTCALFKAVIKGCLNESIQSNDQKEYSKELFKETLEPRAPLLVKFLGGEAVKELKALLVLQQLMEELQHPAGLLNLIFEQLYHLEIISRDAFLSWEKDDSNIPGKAVAVKSATRFFVYLAEQDESHDEEEVDIDFDQNESS